MLHLYPLGILLCAFSLAWWVKAIHRVVSKLGFAQNHRWSAVAVLILLAAGVYAATFENQRLRTAFGSHVTYPNQKPAHDFMSMMIRDDSLVMSIDPGFTRFYLQRPVDYWMREQYNEEKKRHQPFPDEYKQGYPTGYFVDSPAKLKELLAGTKQEIWFYVNEKYDWAVSPAMNEIVSQHFRVRYQRKKTFVLWRPRVDR
jgi:hypothetical protein